MISERERGGIRWTNEIEPYSHVIFIVISVQWTRISLLVPSLRKLSLSPSRKKEISIDRIVVISIGDRVVLDSKCRLNERQTDISNSI